MIEFSLLLLDTWLIGTGAQFFKYIQSREASNWKECFIEGLAHTLKGRKSAACHIPFLPSFLLTIYQKASLVPSIFIIFFLLVWQNSWQKWLKEDRVYLDSQFKGMRSFAAGKTWQGKQEVPGNSHSQEAENKGYRCSASFVLFIQISPWYGALVS